MVRSQLINYENWHFSEWFWECVNFLWQITVLILLGLRVGHCETEAEIVTTLTLTEKTAMQPNFLDLREEKEWMITVVVET